MARPRQSAHQFRSPAIMLMSPVGAPVNSTGEEIRLRSLVADLEKQVHEQSARLSAATRELEMFSHSMSHDLRAPLRGIAGFTRSLVEGHGAQLDDEGRRILNLIRDEARRMGQLIEDLVAFSRVASQRLEVAEVNMTDLAQSAFQIIVEPITTCVPSIRVATLPAANADRVMVRQIFNHLLGNAVKFTRGQTGAGIDVTGTTEGGWNTYCVADNGVGFNQRYAHKLFGVFQRLHSQEDFEGTGVGLAVVQRIVRRHGGRTWAEGEVNGGARFYFILPGATKVRA